jgi:hypothetical protein
MASNEKTPMPPRILIGIFGWILTFSALGIGGTLLIYDLVWASQNPYVGVVIYLITPMFISAGVGLVGLSWFLRYRRRKRYGQEAALLVDLRNPSHLMKIKTVGMGLTLFACVSAVATYRSYQFAESTQFCGLTCHKVMTPEYTTYRNSPHASVACVECHIGAGADWYVKSKMSGLRQVYRYSLSTYHLPVETPIRNLRPARETCQECHWPEKFSGNLEKTLTHYQKDEANTPYSVRLLLKVGGGQGEKATGIHWHVSSGQRIEYIASDRQRMTIPWVRMTGPDGKTTVFTSKDCDPNISSSTEEKRTMDCIDCHNRPSHIFNDPAPMVDKAIASGDIDVHLPNVKSTIMELFEKPYPSTPSALAALEKGLKETYLAGGEVKPATLEPEVQRAVQAIQKVYSSNFFPEMGVDWTTHPNFIGHFRWDGCYRCHDGEHTSQSGEVISHDCNTCHLMIGQGEGFEETRNMPYGTSEFNHPMDMGALSPGDKCTDCHAAPPPTDYSKGPKESVQAQAANPDKG